MGAPLIGKSTRELEKEFRKLDPEPKKIKIVISEEAEELLDEYRKRNRFYSDNEIVVKLLKKELQPQQAELPKTERKTTTVARTDTRYIAAEVKRKIQERAKGQCEYVSPMTGIRCEERRGLEFDHIVAFARGAPSTLGNLRLLCKKCNQRQAIVTFGQQKMDYYLNR